jgi:hypothetical protein
MIIWRNEMDGVEIRERGLEEKRNDSGQRRRKQKKNIFSDRLTYRSLRVQCKSSYISTHYDGLTSAL